MPINLIKNLTMLTLFDCLEKLHVEVDRGPRKDFRYDENDNK